MGSDFPISFSGAGFRPSQLAAFSGKQQECVHLIKRPVVFFEPAQY
jgi:hypothetical protein